MKFVLTLLVSLLLIVAVLHMVSVDCQTCEGLGQLNATTVQTPCKPCAGTGKRKSGLLKGGSGKRLGEVAATCLTCRGRGYLVSVTREARPCPRCEGDGRVTLYANLTGSK